MSDTDDVLFEPEEDAATREIIFANVLADHQAEVAYNRERSRAGWWIGGIGAAIGVLGVASTAITAAFFHPVVRYTEIDDASGQIRESFGAADAPDHYSERVIDRYLSEYVELRERWVWQMDPETFHRVTLMSSPEEQARYAADRDKADLPKKYGMTGYARVTKFVLPFLQRAKGKDKTLEYDVQFIKSEVLATNLTKLVETRMTARIIFQFHPEIKMNASDRLSNEAGLMVISYNATPD